MRNYKEKNDLLNLIENATEKHFYCFSNGAKLPAENLSQTGEKTHAIVKPIHS